MYTSEPNHSSAWFEIARSYKSEQMQQNAIFCVGRQPGWVKTARHLKSRLGWVPQYWIARRERLKEAAAAFPDAIMHIRYELNRGVPAPECKDYTQGALSDLDVRAAQYHILMALNLLERGDLGRSCGHQEALREIYRLLIYWNTVIIKHDIDICIFSTPPHSAAEYMLYASCDINHIKCRMIRPTGLNNINIVCDSLHTPPRNLILKYDSIKNDRKNAISEELDQELQSIIDAKPDYRPMYVAQTQMRSARKTRVVEALRAEFSKGHLKRRPLVLGRFPYRIEHDGNWIQRLSVAEPKPKERDNERYESAYKVPGQTFADSFITRRQFAAYRQWAMIEKFHIEREYESKCVPVELDTPYVYFALHYQPERTTFPDGGVFGDQFLAIRLILQTLPSGWRVYIKEHPSQFLFNMHGELGRWAGYYNDLIDDDRVSLVDQTMSSLVLLDHCKAVGTITGRVGWEALLRGKPVLCFGNAWFSGCGGSYSVREHADAANAFDSILSGAHPNEFDVRCFAAALESVGAQLDHSRSLEESGGLEVSMKRNELLIAFEQSEMNFDIP